MLLALLLLTAAPAAQDAAPANAPRKEARICRRVGNTGSRMDDKRVCKPKSEWDRIDAQNNMYGVDADHTNAEERKRGGK